MVNVNEPTALVIEHTIKKGSERRYEKWLAEILEAVKKAPGYIGREIFPPIGSSKPYITLVRFKTHQDLRSWLDSAERKDFIRKVQDALDGGDKITVKTGIDVWFMPENAPDKPPAYKQFLITLAAIYPLTLIVPRLVAPLAETFTPLKNPFFGNFTVAVIIVGLMTYLIMPKLNGWLRGWLFKRSASR